MKKFTFNPFTGNLDSIDTNPHNYIQFNTQYIETAHNEGRLHWNQDDGTIEIDMPGGSVGLQIGQEMHIRATNDQGSDILNGQIVYVSGASGVNPLMKLTNNLSQTASKTIAVATENITTGQKGYFTTFGLVRDVNTSGFSAGDAIYLGSTDGNMTNVAPDYPALRIKIGYCMRSHATEGVILVNIEGDQWLKRFQAMGDPTGFDRNITNYLGTMSFDDGTRTFTIAPVGGQDDFRFWNNAREIRKTTPQTVIIDDTEGLWFIYFDTTDTLIASQTPWDFNTGKVFVAIVYWDSTNNKSIILGEERHGISMDWATHQYLHNTQGSVWKSGATPSVTVDGNGSLNAHCEIQSVSSGVMYDEDIANNSSEQTTYEIMYKDGANGYWRKTIASAAAVNVTVTRPNYNEWTGATWQRTEVDNTKFTLTHLFFTNDIIQPYKLIMGQNQYNSSADARDGAQTELSSLELSGLPTVEFTPIATFIVQCVDAYTNNYNARLISTDDGSDFIDWRFNERTGVGASTNHHGNLTGLTEDDHTQYLSLTPGGSLTRNNILGSSNNHINITGDALYIGDGDKDISLFYSGLSYGGTQLIYFRKEGGLSFPVFAYLNIGALSKTSDNKLVEILTGETQTALDITISPTQINAPVKINKNGQVLSQITNDGWFTTPEAAPINNYHTANKKYVDDSLFNVTEFDVVTEKITVALSPSGTKEIQILITDNEEKIIWVI